MSAAHRASPGFPRFGPDERFDFPSPDTADEHGVVCVGGNLSPGMLLSAYAQGMFPWFGDDDPIIWWSPDPRFVLEPGALHVSESMRKVLHASARGKSGAFSLHVDRNFPAVIANCSRAPRPGQDGTWITDDMVDAYCELHRLGYAHSAEAWLNDELVGGLYGVSIGDMFYGESMFTRSPNASKAAFIALVWRLVDDGISLIDSQVRTAHLASLGARDIPRADYLAKLADAVDRPTRQGSWAERFMDFPESARWNELRG